MSEVVTVDPLEAGREAFERRAWQEAYRRLKEADDAGRLSGEDLEALAKSAWWIGRSNECISAFERAYAAFVEARNRAQAAFIALTLRREYLSKLSPSVAQGWLRRAEQLLEGESDVSVAHGYLAIAHGELAFDRGELDHALEHFDRAVEIAAGLDDRDLRAWSAMRRAYALAMSGRLDESWELMEDVAASAIGGELGAHTTGSVFCNVMAACRESADYRRGAEWAEVSKAWCERQDIAGFPGVCRVHRAELMRLTGAWAEAGQEVQRATEELVDFLPAIAGQAFHELGEIRLRIGDLDAAQEAFDQAHELGDAGQPGRKQLLMARGSPDAAAASIRTALDDVDWDRLARARLLPVQADVASVRSDLETADAAARELRAIAEEFGTSAIRASAAHATGVSARLSGDPTQAAQRFREARKLWRDVDAPYEAALETVALGETLAESGDTEAAKLELGSARKTFARLGARPDLARADALLGELEGTRAVSREVRTFMFTDIVGSTALVEAIGDEAWHDLLRWHDQALRRSFAEHAGEEVDHTGDGFFVAFPSGESAIACAAEIQRALVEHRRDHGFAPGVRIGLHAAEASRVGKDYEGAGVHAAARIGALAEGGEILASVETAEEVDGVVLGEPREVSLKGFAAAVRVVPVDWRSTG
jgi:class 3 adenylate cyclase